MHLLLQVSPRMVTRKNKVSNGLCCRNRVGQKQVHTPGVGIQAENEITKWKPRVPDSSRFVLEKCLIYLTRALGRPILNSVYVVL